MKKALLRLEDVEPGGFYAEAEALTRLRAIGDYLKSEEVPFQISLIPRCVIPSIRYDKSIAYTNDPFIISFNNTMRYLKANCGASLGMHGYTHQFSGSNSGEGFEFAYSGCTSNCPEDDPPEAAQYTQAFMNSYAYSRMLKGYGAYEKSGLELDWGYSTPHYTASAVQRQILEASSGIFFEDDPDNTSKRTITFKSVDSPFYCGVIYVPTSLGYVGGSDLQGSVDNMINSMKQYSDDELASFYFHPFLEFKFIQITNTGSVIYDDNSYLKQLIRAFKQEGYTFAPLISLTDFVPSSRMTDAAPQQDYSILMSSPKVNCKTQMFDWYPDTGTWHSIGIDVVKFPNRQNVIQNTTVLLALENWAAGRSWQPLVGDFNGDGYQDIVVRDPSCGNWQVALWDGQDLIPNIGPGDYQWLNNWGAGIDLVPFVGDFNGDGKDDLLVYDPKTGTWKVALSDGKRFIPSIGRGDYTWLKNWAAGSDWMPIVGDFNGDGLVDIAVLNITTGNCNVALSTSAIFEPDPGPGDYNWLTGWAPGGIWQPLAGDFNGDGKIDILAVDKVKGLWKVATSTGKRFIPSNNIFGPWSPGSDMQPYVLDPTGKDRAGIVAWHPYIRGGTFDGAFSVIDKF